MEALTTSVTESTSMLKSKGAPGLEGESQGGKSGRHTFWKKAFNLPGLEPPQSLVLVGKVKRQGLQAPVFIGSLTLNSFCLFIFENH